MHTSTRTSRALLASLVGALLLMQGALVPVLDGSETGRRSVLESQHSPGACVVGHDHTVCAQVGANRAVPADEARLRLPVLALDVRSHADPRDSASAHPERIHRPRAPPSA